MVKVLIVDDAVFMRQMLAKILKDEGIEVCGEAANALEAVEKYKLLKPDLVTMDIVMPLMEKLDGIGAVKEIMDFDPKANLLIVSVMGQESLIKKAIEAGAKDFIFKPFKPGRVIQAVRDVLKNSEGRRNERDYP